jgi:hypothetical protein
MSNGSTPQSHDTGGKHVETMDRPQSAQAVLRLVGRSVRRARGGVILKSTTNSGGLL